MSTTSTSQSDTEPMAAVRHYIENFNKGEVEAMAALCMVPMSILDGLAPHVWHGPTACQDWYRDAMVAGEHEGATEYFVALGEPRHVNVTGDSGYVVVPTTMSFKLHGTPITQTGATFTVALRKVNDRWRLASWAWAKGTTQAA